MFLISDERLKSLGVSDRNARLFGPLVRALLAVVVLAVASRQFLVYREIAETTISVRGMSDFSVFYQSSRRVLEGRDDPYDTGALIVDTSPNPAPNLNPPNFILLTAPLALFPPLTAFWIWTTLSVASALLALRIIFHELCLRLTLTTATWTLLALGSAAATGALLLTAQISWLLWGPVTWMWAMARRGRWISAAVVLGMTMSMKPFIGLLLLSLAFRRKWLALVIAGGVAFTSFSLGAAVLGFRPFISWIEAVRRVTWAGHVFNSSLFGVSSRLLTDRPLPIWQLEPFVRAPEWIPPIWIVAAGALLTVAMWKLYGRQARTSASDEHPSDVDREFATMLSSALLITPLGWIYYHFLLAGPFVALFSHKEWREALHWRRFVLAGAIVCFVLSPGTLMSGQPNPWATLTVGSAYFWGLLGVWTCAMVSVPRPAWIDSDPTSS